MSSKTLSQNQQSISIQNHQKQLFTSTLSKQNLQISTQEEHIYQHLCKKKKIFSQLQSKNQRCCIKLGNYNNNIHFQQVLKTW